MNENPLISFIIPCYNFSRYINQCVESICNQTYSNIEVIIVNDGSTDNSKDVIDNLVSKDSRIFAIHKQNEGVSIARNAGITNSHGDYLVFVDADDFISDDYAEYMLSIAQQTHSDFVLSLNCYTRKNEPQISKDNIYSISPEDAVTLLLSPRVIVGSWNKMYSRKLFIENKIQFSSKLFYGEGLRVITQIAQVAKSTGVGLRKVYYYRRNNELSACTNFNIEKHYNGMLSLELIENSLSVRTKKVLNMIEFHKCLFNMGTIVRIHSAHKVYEYKDYYNKCLNYVRKHTFSCLFTRKVSLYKKALLLACCCSPGILARLDILRRKKNQSMSVD